MTVTIPTPDVLLNGCCLNAVSSSVTPVGYVCKAFRDFRVSSALSLSKIFMSFSSPQPTCPKFCFRFVSFAKFYIWVGLYLMIVFHVVVQLLFFLLSFCNYALVGKGWLWFSFLKFTNFSPPTNSLGKIQTTIIYISSFIIGQYVW